MIEHEDESAPIRALMTRRQSLVLGLSASAVGLLAACSSSATTTKTASGRGSLLTIQFQGVPNSLNPALVTLGDSQLYTWLTYDPFIYADPQGNLHPDLAASWGYEGSGNTKFTIKLREGLRFSDGQPLTADAVRQYLEYVQAQKTVPALANLSSVTTPDNYTVQLTFSQPTPELESVFSQRSQAGTPASPAAVKNPNSLETGSYGVGQYVYSASQSVAGSSYVFLANPKYYFNPAAIHYDKVEVRTITDPSQVNAAVLAGQIDVAYTPIVRTAPIPANANPVAAPYVFWCLLTFDRLGEVVKPLGDVRVRQAMSYAIDGPALATALLENKYMSNTQSILSPGVVGYSSNLVSPYPYDPAKAQALLSEAGYPHGFTLPIAALEPNDPGGQFTEAVAGMLNKVGIKTTIRLVPTLTEFIPLQVGKKLPLMVHQPLVGLSMLDFWNTYLTPTSAFNPWQVTDPQLDALMTKALSLPPAQAALVYQQAAERVTELAWFNPVYQADQILLVNKDTQGVAMSAVNNLPNPVAPTASGGFRSAT